MSTCESVPLIVLICPFCHLCSTPAVIRGASPYGNFLADDEPDHHQHQTFESLRAGAESSLSMVSDYTLSYGTDALEPARMVMGQDGRFVPAYVALDRKVRSRPPSAQSIRFDFPALLPMVI